MDHTDVITILVAFAGMLGGIWKISRDFREDLERVRADFKASVDLIFQRFDDHKTTVDHKLFLLHTSTDEKFVRLDLCTQIHGSTNGRLKSIETKQDAILQAFMDYARKEPK